MSLQKKYRTQRWYDVHLFVRCGWSAGYCGYGRGEGGVRHHANRRQLLEHRQGGDVGPEHLRQHLKVSSVPADSQRGCRPPRVYWSMRRPGQRL